MHIGNPTLFCGKGARWLIYSLVVAIIGLMLSARFKPASADNDFDLSDPLVPRTEIQHGGPPRDGIPAIDVPRFVNAVDVDFLKPEDTILGLKFEGVVRAYPIRILNYHEIVNDRIQGQMVVISYCPLCGSGMAFRPDLPGSDNSFGVSGLLYNSDMLLYDRQTESLWSQIMATAISGKLKGKTLKMLPLNHTTWSKWRSKHPDSQVLSTDTGYQRDYQRHPYGDYDVNRAIYFPVSNTNARYHPKERVIGLVLDKQAKAYPISELARQGNARLSDRFAGKNLVIDYDAKSRTARIYDEQNRQLPATSLFWFAWVAFHPGTQVYEAKTEESVGTNELRN